MYEAGDKNNEFFPKFTKSSRLQPPFNKPKKSVEGQQLL